MDTVWKTECKCPPNQPQGYSDKYDAIFCRTCKNWVESPGGFPDRPPTAEQEQETNQ